MNRQPDWSVLIRRLPLRWLIGLLLLLWFYSVVQPWVYQRMGWRQQGERPSKAEEMVPGDPVTLPPVTLRPDSKAPADPIATPAQPSSRPAPPSPPKPGDLFGGKMKDSTPQSKVEVESSKSLAAGKGGKNAPAVAPPDDTPFLLPQPGDRFLSPEGLVYTPGSEEGHRLRHIEKHLQDDPGRPGRHGVFHGTLDEVLRRIDEAYRMGREKNPNVRIREEDGRKVYEATFEKTIGYIGGRDGKRSGNPATKRMRMVLDGQRVITAFPF
jgi:hypothetical protein